MTGDIMDRLVLTIASFVLSASSGVCFASDSSNTAGMAPGHAFVEQAVESFYSQNQLDYRQELNFGSEATENLRAYIANSALTMSSSSELSSMNSTYVFCPDGAFHYRYTSVSSVGSYSGDISVSGTSESEYSGYWAAAYALTGNDALILYSTNEEFLEENSPLPFMLLPIAHYQHDLVQLGLKGQAAAPDMLLGREVHRLCG
jgi:hypothetical protein